MTGFEQPSSTAAADRLPYFAPLGLGALDAAGYSVIAPVTPAVAAATGAGPALIGALVASFPTGMLAGFYLAGHGVRRQRRQAVLLAALALLALGCLGYLAGPLVGGGVAQALGFQAIGAVPLAVAVVLLIAFRWASRQRSG